MSTFKRLKFILGQFKSSFRLVFVDFKNVIFKKKSNTLNFDKHYIALIEVLKKFENVKNKNIIILNVDKGGSFYNYPEGVDKTFSNLRILPRSRTVTELSFAHGLIMHTVLVGKRHR